MGMSYDVELNLTIKDEVNAVHALQVLVYDYEGNDSVNLNLGLNNSRGIGTDRLDDLLQIFFSSCSLPPVPISHNGDCIKFRANFKGTYGWEGVMIEAFKTLAPFCEDGSEFYVITDYGDTTFTVKGSEVCCAA